MGECSSNFCLKGYRQEREPEATPAGTLFFSFYRDRLSTKSVRFQAGDSNISLHDLVTSTWLSLTLHISQLPTCKILPILINASWKKESACREKKVKQ